MSDAVCLAAMMPATLAACSGSPFFTLPLRTIVSASRDMRIDPRAIASRSVTGLAPTSTIRTRPRASTWDNRPVRRDFPALLFFFAMREKERKALERHRQVDALQFDTGRNLQRARREIQHGLDSRADHLVDNLGGRRRGDGKHGDADAVPLDGFLEIPHVVDRHAAARLLTDLRRLR